MSKLIEKKLQQQHLINELMTLIYEAERCFKGKFVHGLAVIVIRYLEDPAAAGKAELPLRHKPINCFFKKQILPRINTLTVDPVEGNYLLAWLLNKLASRLAAEFINSLNRQELFAGE